MADDPAQPKLGKHGGARVKGQQGNATLRTRGNSSAYYVARLQREGHDDALELIRQRRLTPYAVAVQLGWVKRPKNKKPGESNQAKRRRYRFNAAALIG
jgi:hypothetical protein